MADLEKTIRGLECCAAMSGDQCARCPYAKECEEGGHLFGGTAHLCADALSLLKVQEPRVLTLEELYDAEYVFFEDDRTGVLCLLPCGDDEYETYFTSRHCDIIQRRKENYSKSWRCWTSRPSDSERGNTPWEN